MSVKEEPEAARRMTQRPDGQRSSTPRRRRQTSDNPFHIAAIEIPDGSTWEWKRVSTFGQVDVENQITAKEAGWLPVTWEMRDPMTRPPGLTEIGMKEPVIRKGLMLMERPVELTQEAIGEERQRANQQVTDKFRELGQAPADTMTRQHPNLKNRIQRDYAPAGISVPGDDGDPSSGA